VVSARRFAVREKERNSDEEIYALPRSMHHTVRRDLFTDSNSHARCMSLKT
jgi:hypothetical protein